MRVYISSFLKTGVLTDRKIIKMKHYMICSQARSGTHFLQAHLVHLKVGNPGEFFLRNVLRTFKDIEDLLKYNRGGYWGITVFPEYLTQGIKKLKELSGISISDDFTLLNTLFPGIKFIHYYRINKVKHAISVIKAGRTKVFVKKPNTPTPPYNKEFCRDEILRTINKLTRREAAWLNFFDRHKIIPHVLTYEDLCRDSVTALGNLLRFLECDDIEDVAEALSGVKLPIRQYDEISEEWYQKYLLG